MVPAEMQLNAISTENENEYIIVKNVAIGEPDNKNFTITDADENTITVSQFSSVAQSCPTLCDPMDRSTPGLPVHHQLPEFTETHVH